MPEDTNYPHSSQNPTGPEDTFTSGSTAEPVKPAESDFGFVSHDPTELCNIPGVHAKEDCGEYDYMDEL